jgi:hypothetical protein
MLMSMLAVSAVIASSKKFICARCDRSGRIVETPLGAAITSLRFRNHGCQRTARLQNACKCAIGGGSCEGLLQICVNCVMLGRYMNAICLRPVDLVCTLPINRSVLWSTQGCHFMRDACSLNIHDPDRISKCSASALFVTGA